MTIDADTPPFVEAASQITTKDHEWLEFLPYLRKYRSARQIWANESLLYKEYKFLLTKIDRQITKLTNVEKSKPEFELLHWSMKWLREIYEEKEAIYSAKETEAVNRTREAGVSGSNEQVNANPENDAQLRVMFAERSVARLDLEDAERMLDTHASSTPLIQSLINQYNEIVDIAGIYGKTSAAAKRKLSELQIQYDAVTQDGAWNQAMDIMEDWWEQNLQFKRKDWQLADQEGSNEVIVEAPFAQAKTLASANGEIALAIEKGLPKDLEQADRPNEDRVYVKAVKGENDFTVLSMIDGIGKNGHGDLAAEIMARTTQECSGNEQAPRTEEVFTKASEEMFECGVEEGGVAVGLAVIDGDQLHLRRAGDVKQVVIRGGRIIFASEDQGYRHEIYNSVTAFHDGDAENPNEEVILTLEEDDIVLMFTDGVTDNMLPSHYQSYREDNPNFDVEEEEAAATHRIAQIFMKHDNLADAIKEIGEISLQEMKGFGKRDNLGLLAFRFKKL